MSDLFIARQPIYDRNQAVYGYEILYRSGPVRNAATIVDGEQATSEVILNTLVEVGLQSLVGDKLAFINFTRSFIVTESPLVLPVGQVVLEVLEDIPVDDELIAAVRHLASLGYPIALDDFFFREELADLVGLASIVKIDILAMSPQELERTVTTLRRFPVRLLAEKVETQAQYQYCYGLGFDLFQGYFFCEPRIIKRNRVPANRMNTLRLLAKLQNPRTDFKDIEKIIAQDVTLSYRLLRYINSAFFGLRKKMDSVHRAIVYLGYRNIRTWATVIALSGVDDKPTELLTTALVRARMCELMADALRQPSKDSYFTVGLLSVLDALLDTPMKSIMDEMPLSDVIDEALLQHTGLMGEVLQVVLDYERGNWEAVVGHDFPAELVRRSYIDAVRWAQDALVELDGGK